MKKGGMIREQPRGRKKKKKAYSEVGAAFLTWDVLLCTWKCLPGHSPLSSPLFPAWSALTLAGWGEPLATCMAAGGNYAHNGSYLHAYFYTIKLQDGCLISPYPGSQELGIIRLLTFEIFCQRNNCWNPMRFEIRYCVTFTHPHAHKTILLAEIKTISRN